MTDTVLDVEQIKQLLPHRAPMLLVEKLADIVPRESATGYKAVSINEPWFMGHFPDKAVMPGVLIVEAMAQAGAVLMSKSLNADVERKTIFFMSLDACRFRQPVRPGDVLHMKVQVLKARAKLFKFRGEAMVGDKVAAEAEWAAMVVETG